MHENGLADVQPIAVVVDELHVALTIAVLVPTKIFIMFVTVPVIEPEMEEYVAVTV